MKTYLSKNISAFLTISALLFIVGCGSENGTTHEPHSGEHMDEHTSHDGMAQDEPSGTDSHDHQDGNRHHQGNMMTDQPDDARLVSIIATDYEFSPAEVLAKPGEKLFIKLTNKGNSVHMWQIRDRPETHVHTPVGETSAKVVTAPETPGNYKVLCMTPGHEERGMVGTLKVSE